MQSRADSLSPRPAEKQRIPAARGGREGRAFPPRGRVWGAAARSQVRERQEGARARERGRGSELAAFLSALQFSSALAFRSVIKLIKSVVKLKVSLSQSQFKVKIGLARAAFSRCPPLKWRPERF